MYEIKKDYIHGTSNVSFDDNRTDGTKYWNRQRIASSLVYQYSFYKWVYEKYRKQPQARILDVGCGPGTKLMHFFGKKNFEVVGIDQPDAVDYCNTKFAKYTNASFHADNFDDPVDHDLGTFDAIICSDVIEHLERPDNLLAFIKRFADDNTRIFLSTPERDRLRGKDNTRSPKVEHLREWNQPEFERFLEKSGYEVLESKIFTFMKPNLYYPHGLKYVKNVLLRLLYTNQGVEARIKA
ncbi:MAG: class I SAM-dependent methyltransferase [Flavobacteriales bacterium]|nr:class I SAM-dependent methyltransferase [Flavobacteriales bacterium]